jgi:hypothetical protein
MQKSVDSIAPNAREDGSYMLPPADAIFGSDNRPKVSRVSSKERCATRDTRVRSTNADGRSSGRVYGGILRLVDQFHS